MQNSVLPLPEPLRRVAPGFHVDDPLEAPPLRWGILGPGGIARTFASAVSGYSSGTVTAVGSRDLGRAQAFAAEFDVPHAFGSYSELVSCPDVDAVYISTPHMRHHEDALLALQAGKPVLVEKAFTMTRREAEEIFEVAKQRGLFVMEGMWSRHLPHYRFIREVISRGVAGRLTAITADHSQWLRHVPRLVLPELGGGALLDLGVYPLHLIQFALGNPSEVVARGLPTGTGVDAAEVILATYPQALAVASASMDGINATAATVTFESLSIEIPNQFYRPTDVYLRTFPGRESGSREEKVTRWDARVPFGFQYQAAEAARCIAAGLLESPTVTWADTLAVMGIMDEVREQLAVSFEK